MRRHHEALAERSTGRRALSRTGAAALAVVLGGVILTGCGGDDGASGPAAVPAAVQSQLAAVAGLNQGTSTVLTANGASVDIYQAPTATKPTRSLSNPNENGAPRVFLVQAKMPGWWQVLLPVEPNGSTGWVKAAQVNASQTPYRIEVARGAHVLRLFSGDQKIAEEKVAIGTSDTPTPGGRFFLMELLRPSNPNGAYGPYAFGLSGFSTSLDDFGGRDPVIGIHGTNDPSSLGRDVSHGCIRLSNDSITRLAQTVPLGTPVEIVAGPSAPRATGAHRPSAAAEHRRRGGLRAGGTCPCRR
ncbi:ErfK/YbiS/YcfS/YnhG family protein, partial [Parafrankia sp. EUN1f]